MPDFPPEAIQAAAEVRLRQYDSEYPAAHLTWRDFETEVREMLDACAESLGEHVAVKIGQHRDKWGTSMAASAAGRWRRYFGIAAQVAAHAFLTEDDRKRIAARELAAGNFAACEIPEGNTCEWFRWIGQPFTSCDDCGRPAWEHVGMLRYSGSPSGTEARGQPWKPGEAEATRRKWDPDDASPAPGEER